MNFYSSEQSDGTWGRLHHLCCSKFCYSLHTLQHVVKQLQVLGGEHLGHAGPQFIHMVPCHSAAGAEVGGHLFHHVTVAQACHLQHDSSYVTATLACHYGLHHSIDV